MTQMRKRIAGVSVVLMCCGACNSGGTNAEIASDNTPDTAGNTDRITDTDSDMGTDIGTDSSSDSETETDAALLECYRRYGGCTQCLGDCMDGFGYELQYPTGAWDPETATSLISPTEDLEAASVTYYFCAVCGSCGKDLKIRPLDGEGVPGDWVDVEYREFCRYLLDYDDACGGCLEIWYGGAGK